MLLGLEDARLALNRPITAGPRMTPGTNFSTHNSSAGFVDRTWHCISLGLKTVTFGTPWMNPLLNIRMYLIRPQRVTLCVLLCHTARRPLISLALLPWISPNTNSSGVISAAHSLLLSFSFASLLFRRLLLRLVLQNMRGVAVQILQRVFARVGGLGV